MKERTEDRLLRIAREAGYEPTGCEKAGGLRVLKFEHKTQGTHPYGVSFGGEELSLKLVSFVLKCYAGPENQPDAVRARREAANHAPVCEACGAKDARRKDDMVDAIIAAQCAAGGVDTEGSRHEAERWCAWLCQCVCDGMRATTEQSAYRKADSDLYWGLDYQGKRKRLPVGGKPLGRP